MYFIHMGSLRSRCSAQGFDSIALSRNSSNLAWRQNKIGGSSQPRTCACYKINLLRNSLFTLDVELFHNCIFARKLLVWFLVLALQLALFFTTSIICIFSKIIFDGESLRRVLLLEWKPEAVTILTIGRK